jgi:hypothetical protein
MIIKLIQNILRWWGIYLGLEEEERLGEEQLTANEYNILKVHIVFN